MASNRTANYALSQWERSDKVLMEDFNADNAKIDAAVKAVDQRVDGKADASALEAEVSARTAAVSALNTAVSKLGNCRIRYFTYTGTGTFGNDNPTPVAFPDRPVFFTIFGDSELIIMARDSQYPLFLGKYKAVNYELMLTTTRSYWQGNTLMLHSYESILQMNREGIVYHVVAFYSQDGR